MDCTHGGRLLSIPNNEATAMRAVHPRRYSCLDVHLPPRSLRLVDGASLVPARTAACIFVASLILSTRGLLKFWQSRFINAWLVRIRASSGAEQVTNVARRTGLSRRAF